MFKMSRYNIFSEICSLITVTSLWARWHLKSPAARLFTKLFIQGAVQRKHQSSASLSYLRGIHRWPVNSPHKGSVTRKCFHLMTSSYVLCFHIHVLFGAMLAFTVAKFIMQSRYQVVQGDLLFKAIMLGNSKSQLLGTWVAKIFDIVLLHQYSILQKSQVKKWIRYSESYIRHYINIFVIWF